MNTDATTFEKDEPLLIARVANGYLVRTDSPMRRPNESRSMVFQSAHGLLIFLSEHFTHRAESVPTDPSKDAK